MVRRLLFSEGMSKTRSTRAALTLLLSGVLAITATRSATAATAESAGRPAEARGNASCQKLPAGQRMVKLNLKPETELGDLIVWISSITCKQFLLPGTIPANSKRVTIVAPQLMSPEEAYRLFLSALDSVGLTVYPTGKFLRIVETSKAKGSALPVYVSQPPGATP
jgi:general secretion pathway protein D